MRLQRLSAGGFRNLEPFEQELAARFVVFHGRNGQGKTNSLEAIYFLTTLRPLRSQRIREMVRLGGTEARVSGMAEREGSTRCHSVHLSQGERKRAFLDGKPVTELVEYFEGIRAIAFVPQDGGIVSGEPARRRAWLDRAAFTAAPAHLEAVRACRRLIDQKAAALRTKMSDEVLDALDARFAKEAARLVTRRLALLEEIRPHVEEVHGTLAGEESRLQMRYRTEGGGQTIEERVLCFERLLHERRSRERERQLVLVGPQRDDVEFFIDKQPVRAFGSQGQLRTVVLALKLAELIAAKERGDVPLFLIDDVGSELDSTRKERLIGALSDVGAQLFATTTDAAQLATLPRNETLFLRVEDGRLRVED